MTGAFYGAVFDPGANEDQAWIAVVVYRDGNPIHLGRFSSEEVAEDFALSVRDKREPK